MVRSTLTRFLLLALLATALVVAGCGGGDSSTSSTASSSTSTSSTTSVSSGDYASQLKGAVCTFANNVQQAAGQLTDSSSLQERAQVLNAITDEVDKAVSQVQSLEPPGAAASAQDALAQAMSAYKDALASTAQAIQSGDLSALPEIKQQLNSAGQAFQQTASSLDAQFSAAGVKLSGGC